MANTCLCARHRQNDSFLSSLSSSIDTRLSNLYDKGWETIMKEGAILIVVLLLCVSLLSPQSLVEVAKKEKERREKLKGKKSIVVTNEILEKRKNEPSISIRSLDPPTSEISTVAEIPEGRSLGHILPQASSYKDQTSFFDLESLEAKWTEAQEQVALLTLQLNALWHKYNNMNAMTPRDLIQKQISETYLRLQKAQQDADQAKRDLELARRNKRKNLSENR